MTISKLVNELTSTGAKMGVENISALEAGGMKAAHSAEGKLAATYAAMYASGIRPTDYLSHKNRESTATAEAYAERGNIAAMICYTKAERAQLSAKLSKDATDAEKAARKALQNVKTDLLKTIRRGLITQDKINNPEAYATGAADRKEAIEKLGIAIDTAEKIMQGDGLPEWFDAPEAVAVIKAFRKKYRVPTKQTVDIDSII